MNKQLLAALSGSSLLLLACGNDLPASDSKISATATKPFLVVANTGNVEHGGTDAEVKIAFIGTRGTTPFYKLNNPNVDDFVRGKPSTFKISVPTLLGDIVSVVIKHNNAKDNPGWFLTSILVTDISTNKRSSFPFNRWLRKEGGDTTCALLSNGDWTYLRGSRTDSAPTPGTIATGPNLDAAAGTIFVGGNGGGSRNPISNGVVVQGGLCPAG